MIPKLTFLDKEVSEDVLRVYHSKKKVRFTGNLIRYRDKDTRQIIIHVPSLDISGYGSDEVKAEEMLRFNLNEYFTWLVNLSAKNTESELSDLGWKHIKFKNKEYSKSYVDGDGNLKGLNAVADEVERLTVTA